MKGVLSIEGANTFAWIAGYTLLDAIDAIDMTLVAAGTVLVYQLATGKVDHFFIEIAEGRVAVRYPITKWPNFRWAKEPVDEVEIFLSVAYDGTQAHFPIPIADLTYNPEGSTNFRQWALKRYREWARKPTEANSLASLLAKAEEMGWVVAQYSPPNTDMFPASPKSQRDENRNYKVTLKKAGGQQYITMAPNFPSFIRSLTALIESLPELDKEAQNATPE